jgi:hypothetical protein
MERTSGGVRQQGPGAATGAPLFVGMMLALSGVLSILEGISGIARDRLYSVPGQYEYRFGITAWGWINLVVGILLLVAALGMLGGKSWGRPAALGLAAVSLVTQFMFVPYYPLWSIAVMTLDLVILWSVSRLLD